jgi:NADH dehydrogenase
VNDSKSSQTVAVAGATGFVGRYVVRELLDRGARVRALTRSGEKASDVLPEHENLKLVYGDVFDRDTVRELVDGCDAIVNCIGIRREVGTVTFERMHVRVVEILADAAKEAGVSRFVQISAIGTRPNAKTDYHRSKFEGESLLRRSGLDWTILRPSLVHGPDGELMKMIKDWSLGRAAPHVFIPYFADADFDPTAFPPKPPKPKSATMQPVAVESVAAAVADSLERTDAIGEVYPLGGSERVTWPELLEHVRDEIPMAGKKKIIPIPGKLGYAMAVAAKPFGLAQALPFGPSEPLMAIEDNTCDTHKAEQDLGFVPSSFREGVTGYADRI